MSACRRRTWTTRWPARCRATRSRPAAASSHLYKWPRCADCAACPAARAGPGRSLLSKLIHRRPGRPLRSLPERASFVAGPVATVLLIVRFPGHPVWSYVECCTFYFFKKNIKVHFFVHETRLHLARARDVASGRPARPPLPRGVWRTSPAQPRHPSGTRRGRAAVPPEPLTGPRAPLPRPRRPPSRPRRESCRPRGARAPFFRGPRGNGDSRVALATASEPLLRQRGSPVLHWLAFSETLRNRWDTVCRRIKDARLL